MVTAAAERKSSFRTSDKKNPKEGSIGLRALAKVTAIVRAFQQLNMELPMQQAAALLYIAANEGCMVLDMANATGMTQSAASRNIAALGKWARYGKPGLELIRTEEDPMERRRKLLYLTPKGRNAVQAIIEHI